MTTSSKTVSIKRGGARGGSERGGSTRGRGDGARGRGGSTRGRGGAVRGGRGGAVRGGRGGVVRGGRGGAVRGSRGAAAIRGSRGGAAIRGSRGGAAVRGARGRGAHRGGRGYKNLGLRDAGIAKPEREMHVRRDLKYVPRVKNFPFKSGEVVDALISKKTGKELFYVFVGGYKGILRFEDVPANNIESFVDSPEGVIYKAFVVDVIKSKMFRVSCKEQDIETKEYLSRPDSELKAGAIFWGVISTIPHGAGGLSAAILQGFAGASNRKKALIVSTGHNFQRGSVKQVKLLNDLNTDPHTHQPLYCVVLDDPNAVEKIPVFPTSIIKTMSDDAAADEEDLPDADDDDEEEEDAEIKDEDEEMEQ